MKKFLVLVLMICLVLAMPIANSSLVSVSAAQDKNTVILVEAAKQEKDKKEIKINVNVKENSGIHSMVLGIDYNNTALSLTNVEYGSALASLDEKIASATYDTYPYKISFVGPSDYNDYSTGKLMTLTFKVKEGAVDGDYTIKLSYEKDKDIVYVEGNAFPTKNIITNSVKITLKGSEVEKISTEKLGDNNLTLTWGLIGGAIGIVVIAAVVTVIVIQRKKGKWVKLW